MNTQLSLLAALASLGTLSTPAFAAPLQNGQFTDQLTHWTRVGDVSVQSGMVQGVNLGTAPSLVLGTASTGFIDDTPPVAGALNVSGIAPVEAPDMETMLGLAPDSLSNQDQGFSVQEGSAASQTFFIQAGQTVEFDWRLLTQANTSPSDLPDTAWLLWTLNGQTQTLRLADAAQPDLTPIAGNWLDTGLRYMSISAQASGTATLAFAVADVNSYDTSSLLAIQNVSAVPEPDSVALLLAGLLVTRSLVVGRTRQN